jgi:hypothetical protein
MVAISTMRRVWMLVSLSVALLSFYPAWMGGTSWWLPGLSITFFLIFLLEPLMLTWELRKSGNQLQITVYLCRLNDGPPVNRHCPSVDVLFRSVAQKVGPNAVGVILTGMGDDGARGLKEMRDAGAPTIAQDEATSVVWGMPGAAVKLGAVVEILPLNRVADAVMRLANESAGAQPASAAR